MKKRFLAVFLALALCMGLAPTVFAAEGDFVIEYGGVLTKYNGPGGDVVIPDGVISIGNEAFENCTSMTSVTIPDSVTSFGSGSFKDCTSLTSVVIPDSVISIGSGYGPVFEGCTSLTSVTLPVSYCEWYSSLFDDSTGVSVKDIYYAGSELQLLDMAFMGREISGRFSGREDLLIQAFSGSLSDDLTIHFGKPSIDPLATFTDLKSNGFYVDAVRWAANWDITTGTSATTFSPNKTCTHSEILTFLWRAAGEPESSAQSPITMKGDEFYYKAVKWAAEKGMIDKNFNPKANCTRADAVNYIWQARGWDVEYDGHFTDVPANSSYATAVAWALANGVTTGTTATTFSPNKVCNRGEIVTFLYRTYVRW